ncbi:MAG TPA: hypothetical protein VHN99_09530, partial [Deinococcales bacterium]|nr:hypothetical protein [Deinococcales bacterium]
PVTVTVNVTAPAFPAATASASLTSATPDPDPSNSTLSHATAVTDDILKLAKAALQPSVRVGGQLGYALVLSNLAGLPVNGPTVTDTLPLGLAYEPGTSELSGAAAADPAVTVAGGRQTLTWTLPDLAAGASAVLKFKTHAGPAARGRLVNTATAAGRVGPLGAGVGAQATSGAVAVQPVGDPNATIVGRVYLDENGNGLFETGTDRPVAGAALVADDGRRVTTDEQGRYSLPALSLGSRVLRLDLNTVPRQPEASAQDAGLPGTRLLNLTAPGLYTADFPLMPGQAAQPAASGAVLTGNLTVQANLNPGFGALTALRAYGTGPVDGGDSVTIAVNASLGFDPAAGFTFAAALDPAAVPAFALPADASTPEAGPVSAFGLYYRRQSGNSFFQVGLNRPGFTGEFATFNAAASGALLAYHLPGWDAVAFGGLTPQATTTDLLPGDGTSVYRLHAAPVVPGTERLQVLTRDRDNPAFTTTRDLTPGLDYTLDAASGIVTLKAPLLPTDVNFNPQFLSAAYATVAPVQQLQAGAQVTHRDGPFTVTATYLQPGAGSALAGAALAYDENGVQASLEAAYRDDWAAAARAGYTGNGWSVSARARYATPGFSSLDATRNALDASLNLRLPGEWDPTLNVTTSRDDRTGVWTTNASLLGTAALTPSEWFLAPTLNTGALLRAADGQARAYYQLGLAATLNPLAFGTSATASLTARAPLAPGEPGELESALTVPVGENVNLEVRDLLTTSGANSGSLQVSGHQDGTTVTAAYDLPNASGAASRARVGVDSNIPLAEGLSAEVNASAGTNLDATGAQASLSTSLAYNPSDATHATARAEVSASAAGVKQAYGVALVAQPSERVAISPSIQAVIGPDGTGVNASAAGAYRGDHFSALGTLSVRTGTFATGLDNLSLEVQSSWRPLDALEVRAGLATRGDASAYTGQVNAGASAYLPGTPLGLGAQGAWLFQAGSPDQALSLGLEASLRLREGFTVAAGYNFLGFQSLGSAQTQPGFYVRLDVTFSEFTTAGWPR